MIGLYVYWDVSDFRMASTPVRHGHHKRSHSPGQKTRHDIRDQTAAGSQQGMYTYTRTTLWQEIS